MSKEGKGRSTEESKDRKELMEKAQPKDSASTYPREPNHLRSQ